MSSAVYHHSNGHHKARTMSTSLPVFSPKLQDKFSISRTYPPHWFTRVAILPRRSKRRIWVPNPRRFHYFAVSRFGRVPGSILALLALLSLVFTTFAFAKRFGTKSKTWPAPFTGDPSTLVYKREDLQRIWEWEIASGHYPSRHPIPVQIGFSTPPNNPALPPPPVGIPESRDVIATHTRGTGAKRVYLDIQSQPPDVAYPPRPVPGSIADLDVVMDHCDFSEKKYVRDCLEVLRVGAGLDNENRLRRGEMDGWKHIYIETPVENTASLPPMAARNSITRGPGPYDQEPNSGLSKRRGVPWEQPPIALSPVVNSRPYSTLPSPCDPENPRLFHMFWTGPFTDKPYLAILSFLFTQNTGLYLSKHPEAEGACRPQFWLWINPGPAASVPNPNALHDMYEQLKSNYWASPFLHPRFKDVIHFKLWNTTEQLDGVPELRDEWRSKDLFNSGGHIISVPVRNSASPSAGANGTVAATEDSDDMLNRLGSKSSSSYDRVSVILSDMARFILCHRFGGIYLDADTIFLRDWEELWGWRGAFAYRWSRLEKYNTAVLHLNKGSALGSFLFRTALKNNLDFHPMTVSRYTKDAYLEGLLLRLPDALFDSAWLNTEYYQRERPPQPYFTDFADFFDTPTQSGAAPLALGFNGFFKGAFSYHFHNYWWKPFDPARNFPDLGPRFQAGESAARAALAASGESVSASASAGAKKGDRVADDKRDLDWAAVLKRTFEAYIRGERPNMYGEWLQW
ncbi:hypothetical protein FISHEDRAFT_39271 [Fistulina hepatica ATCC 64428]|uniref:Glycosyltransferase family 32 protein n=1 Tax=Fistulina hepatica ATCC 64428 TaxID=1128425 RepID=A0A0D7AGL4_9AGAR|nr:hypothetical protein FISHEDRAFT_39271 [Fistulina hepatica ATCC 64428]